MKDQTNHHNNRSQSIRTCPFNNQIFLVTQLTIATLTQSITHMNTLTIIHSNKKSTNGSSSRNEQSLVIHHLNFTLKFRQNNQIRAIKITNEDFHSTPENKNHHFDQLASNIGNANRQKVKTAKYNTNRFFW